jgi:hypothetical protein
VKGMVTIFRSRLCVVCVAGGGFFLGGGAANEDGVGRPGSDDPPRAKITYDNVVTFTYERTL